DKAIVRFGRKDAKGGPIPDIEIRHPDDSVGKRVSRTHFQLHRRKDETFIRMTTQRPLEVDGRQMVENEETRVQPGSVIRVSNAVTITLLGDASNDGVTRAS